MVRSLRLLIVASMVVAGVMQVSPMMGSEKSPVLHAETDCALCKKSIQDVHWPDVVAVECDNEHHHHAVLAHRMCIESQKETYKCDTCKKCLSQESKKCLDQTKRIVDAERKFEASKAKMSAEAKAKMERDPRNQKHALFQWYCPYKDEVLCSICSYSLTGKCWPDIVTIHCNANQIGHTYHIECLNDLITNNHACAECRKPISQSSKDLVTETMEVFDGRNLSHPWYLQRHAPVKAPIIITSNDSSYTPYLMNAMKYRILRYPTLFAACACMLHGAYVYSNANWLSVSEAASGMVASTLTGAGVGLFAACLHHAHEWSCK